MNRKTETITREQYETIIDTIRNGTEFTRANDRIATALVLEANLGLRISDILNLRLSDIKYESGRYHLDIVEQKTGKARTFTVPVQILEFIRDYAKRHNIADDEKLFTINQRTVNKSLNIVVDYLGYTQTIGTHSFRKFFATTIYQDNNYNISLVQKLLQHSSAATTQRYIGISEREIEDALQKHIYLR